MLLPTKDSDPVARGRSCATGNRSFQAPRYYGWTDPIYSMSYTSKVLSLALSLEGVCHDNPIVKFHSDIPFTTSDSSLGWKSLPHFYFDNSSPFLVCKLSPDPTSPIPNRIPIGGILTISHSPISLSFAIGTSSRILTAGSPLTFSV